MIVVVVAVAVQKLSRVRQNIEPTWLFWFSFFVVVIVAPKFEY